MSDQYLTPRDHDLQFAEVFRLRSETLFLGVTLMDRFLSDRTRVAPRDLQLVGTSCMLVAAKFEEAPPPRSVIFFTALPCLHVQREMKFDSCWLPDFRSMIHDCCDVSDGAFSEAQVVDMEAQILRAVDYNCAMPTTFSFLW